MILMREDWEWRVLWGALGSGLSTLGFYEALRTGSIGDFLGAGGLSMWTVTWILLPLRVNKSFRENVALNAQAAKHLPIAVKLLSPLGFVLILASLITKFS